MSDLPEDRRLALANLHALALATLRGKDASSSRTYLDALAPFAPDPEPLAPTDPRSDEALGGGIELASARRHFAAKLRGVILGVAAHPETPSGELTALARVVASGESVSEDEVDRRAIAALASTREDLARDIVRLGEASHDGDAGTRVRRWGSVRALELNAFVAAFTREGAHPAATAATRTGRDAMALRFALAVAQAAMSLAQGTEPDESLEEDVKRTELALPALLANLVAGVAGK
jgi:hypothetical protein